MRAHAPITGPLLASLGATGLVVGVVTGVGEAAALILRLVSGPLTDRTGPVLGLDHRRLPADRRQRAVPRRGRGAVGGKRFGDRRARRQGRQDPPRTPCCRMPRRSPAAAAGSRCTRRSDQVGAMGRPADGGRPALLVRRRYGPTLALACGCPVSACWRCCCGCAWGWPEPARYESVLADDETPEVVEEARSEIPAAVLGVLGVLGRDHAGFHDVRGDVVPPGLEGDLHRRLAVPVMVAAAMAVDAVGALADRVGLRPARRAGAGRAAGARRRSFPRLAFSQDLGASPRGGRRAGLGCRGRHTGVHPAGRWVADLVAPPRRATAYGVYAAGHRRRHRRRVAPSPVGFTTPRSRRSSSPSRPFRFPRSGWRSQSSLAAASQPRRERSPDHRGQQFLLICQKESDGSPAGHMFLLGAFIASAGLLSLEGPLVVWVIRSYSSPGSAIPHKRLRPSRAVALPVPEVKA